MQTLLEILKKTEVFFAKKNLGNPRLQAELLLSTALKCKRLELYLQFEKLLDETTLALLRDWVVRRANREPLQYITGETDFRELTLKCDRRALIPRPETEELVEHIFAEIQNDTDEKKEIAALDLGTGTGAIALSFAREKNWNVTAVDKSPAALDLARENAAKNMISEKIIFTQSDWFSALNGTFDIIASNPPYLANTEILTAEIEVREHEPRMALVAENDGLADLEKILENGKCHLRDGGFIALETGIAHHEKLKNLAEKSGYARTKSLKDFCDRDRFFFAWKSTF